MESTVKRGRSKSLFQKSNATKPVLMDEADETLEAIYETAPAAPSMRPPVRDNDPRERAKQRAAELREHLGEVVDEIGRAHV